MKSYYIYLLTNWTGERMYIGVTSNLERRISEHKQKLIKGFTEKYNINKLVYYEEYPEPEAEIAREKEIKKWRREKKDKLVKLKNPDFNDLAAEWG